MIVATAAEMREFEAGVATRGLPGPALMEIAGRACADAIGSIWSPISGRRVVVLVGPGNNGGDGLVIARWLAQRNADVIVATVNRPAIPDAKVDLLVDAGIPIFAIDHSWSPEQIRGLFAGSHLIVDALLGIGRNRGIAGVMAAILEVIAGLGTQIIAIDVPSGLDADSGECDDHTPAATITLTLGAVKRGLILGTGASRAGFVLPLSIGIPSAIESKASTRWLAGARLAHLFPRRDRLGHKGTNGKVMVVAGSDRYLK